MYEPGSVAKEFSALVLKAASDDAAWRDVLTAAISATGAMSGVIALRERQTAAFQFPEEMTSQLAAPLIVGIDAAHVEAYIERFAALDVWTEIERRQHPDQPYFMSEHLARADLERTEFHAKWLQPQKICECLVAEVHRGSGYWVALNLLFDESAFTRQAEIQTRVSDMLPLIRMGWELSERLFVLSVGQTASQGYLESVPVPCLILDTNFVVSSANSMAIRDFSQHAPLAAPLTINAPLALEPCALEVALDSLRLSRNHGDGTITIESQSPGHTLQVSTLAQRADVTGKRHAHFLILTRELHRAAAATPRVPRLWERETLTKMQSAIVKWIAEGGFVAGFAEENNIAKKTAYDHLLAARQKLNGISARDIYMSHQALLLTER